MSDPQSPEHAPARPPLPPQPTPSVEPPAAEAVPEADGQDRGRPEPDLDAARAPAATPPYAPSSSPAYGGASTPPPNPFGQPTAGRHASPSTSAEQSLGFAPPSSPSFAAPAGAAAGYGSYPQAPSAQRHGQPANEASGYRTPGYPTNPQAQQYPAPVTPPRPAKPSTKLANTGLALGVVGVIGGIFFGWTLPFSIAAIVLGFLARPREPRARGVALSTIVTGAVGVLLSLGWLTYSILTWLALTAS